MVTDFTTTLREKIGARSTEETVRSLLERAGIVVGGDAPHDIQVHDPEFYTRVLRDASLGLGESYVDGQWDAAAVDETVCRLLEARLTRSVSPGPAAIALALKAKVTNPQTYARAFRNARTHYDVGNELYEAMLGEHMMYSCGYWRDARTLDAAQEAKLDLVCRKIDLRPGMEVLDLGCGWGGFARFAAERYGARVTGLTVSEPQATLARERCRGLPVEIFVEDYRNARGAYDAVISIGMVEHVGPRNYRAYMEVTDRCLRPDGIALIQVIGGNRSTDHIDPWLEKHVFPGAVLPSVAQLSRAMEGLFALEDVHNFGPDYDLTLMAWLENFRAAWPELRPRYGDRFYRLWSFYLRYCAAAFRARYTQLYQLVLTRPPRRQPDRRAFSPSGAPAPGRRGSPAAPGSRTP